MDGDGGGELWAVRRPAVLRDPLVPQQRSFAPQEEARESGVRWGFPRRELLPETREKIRAWRLENLSNIINLFELISNLWFGMLT